LQISAGGGGNAAWSADGRTVYYVRELQPGGSAMMAVEIATSAAPTAGKPRELFRLPTGQRCTTGRCYDVSQDGTRFLMRDRSADTRPSVTRMDLVLNWTAELKK
jgi:hypothetical protein